MFWGISLLVLLAAGVMSWPLLGRTSGWKIPAVTGILLLPLAGYFLYHGVGTPEALQQTPAVVPAQAPHQVTGDATKANDMGTLAERLRQRLEENPQDVQGWVLLGRSYKTLQNYPLALEALETANRLAPDQPLVQVELVEARLFVSGDPRITPEMVPLEQAVTDRPFKGLVAAGIAAAQQGDIHAAWWGFVSDRAGSQIEQSVLEQMDRRGCALGGSATSHNATWQRAGGGG
jgi:cytochrome c-type biogenesis protein CcmH/NrfG